jgi:hypothetical protein
MPLIALPLRRQCIGQRFGQPPATVSTMMIASARGAPPLILCIEGSGCGDRPAFGCGSDAEKGVRVGQMNYNL